MKEIINLMSNNEVDYSLYGLVLGDGWLSKRHKICIEHTAKQSFYCKWLKDIFSERLQVWGYNDFTRTTSFGEYLYSRIEITPLDNALFFNNGIFLDVDRKKIITEHVLSNITELGLLFWYLDDGSLSVRPEKSCRFASLCTHSFSYDENVMIKNMFKDRFDIDLKIHTDRSGFKKHRDKIYYRLYFSSTSFRKFYDLLYDYLPLIPDGFHYKFNMNYIPNMGKESDRYQKRYNLNHLKAS